VPATPRESNQKTPRNDLASRSSSIGTEPQHVGSDQPGPYQLANPLESAVGLARLLHDRTRDFNAGVRNQVIELLALELTEADHVVQDLLMSLRTDLGDLVDGIDQIELRKVVDQVASELATSRHTRVSVKGDAAVRADTEVATHIIRNLLRCVTYLGGENINVHIGRGFSKIFVEISFDGEKPHLGDFGQVIDGNGASGSHDTGSLPFGLSISVARQLARALRGDVAATDLMGGRGAFELSLPLTLGHHRVKSTIADSIFDPAPDGPTRSDISDIIAGGGPEMVFQPIVDIRAQSSDGPTVVGYEALARFPLASPPEWLEAAGHAGKRLELELCAIASAVEGFGTASHPGFLTVNLSDQTLLSPEFLPSLNGMDPGLIVVELSEVALIKSYEVTRRAMDALRDRGVRLAIDNVGAGEIDLWSILRLQPEMIKIDMSLVRGIETDPTNRALVKGVAAMASDLGILVVAEGIEKAEERDLLVEIGIEFGQGYLLGKPERLRSLSPIP
jgi:EAL domain-containing protein (putative c-di-GMP-specific phosphodiesterase class I)